MITLIVLIIKLNLVNAFDVHEVWSDQNKLHLKFQCQSTDRFCYNLCNQNENCSIEEKMCFNCVGTGLLINAIFEQMGVLFQSTREEISPYELIDFLNQKNFVSFTSRSVYNQIDSYDSPAIKARFQSLCEGSVDYPVVLFELSKVSHAIIKVKYVLCNERIYRMSDSPEVILNEVILNEFIKKNDELLVPMLNPN